MLTGACISRACGFPARVRYATAACVIAAELPDADYVYRLGGPLTYFQHHRGWTHALWSLPLQAAFVVGIFYLLHSTRRHWKKHRSRNPIETNWVGIFLIALMGLLSHILLDWTNNYGVRPFAPWNPHWYAGELVFIVEPILLAVLGLALLLPLLFSLVNKEIGINREKYSGQGLAIAALVCMVGLWSYRAMKRADAQTLADVQELTGGRILRTSLNPYPVNPYKWHVVVETPLNYQSATVDTRIGIFETLPQMIAPKQEPTLAVMVAKKSWLGQIYLDWSQYPQVVDAGTAAQVHPEMELTPTEAAMHVVRFTDLRFNYDAIGLRDNNGRSALGAEAWVDGNRQVRRIYLGTQEQKLP